MESACSDAGNAEPVAHLLKSSEHFWTFHDDDDDGAISPKSALNLKLESIELIQQ